MLMILVRHFSYRFFISLYFYSNIITVTINLYIIGQLDIYKFNLTFLLDYIFIILNLTLLVFEQKISYKYFYDYHWLNLLYLKKTFYICCIFKFKMTMFLTFNMTFYLLVFCLFLIYVCHSCSHLLISI